MCLDECNNDRAGAVVDSKSSESTEERSPTDIQIFVRAFQGQTCTVDCSLLDTIARVHSIVNQKKGRTGQTFYKLSFGTKTLRPELTLRYYNIQKEATLHEVLAFDDQPASNVTVTKFVIVDLSESRSSYSISDDSANFSFALPREIKVEDMLFRTWQASLCDKQERQKSSSFRYSWMSSSSQTYEPSGISLWCGLTSMGDGWQRGTVCELEETLRRYVHHGKQIFHNRWTCEIQFHVYGHQPNRNRRKDMTRLETVKQLFHAFINRSQAYNYANHIGLMVFNDKIEYKCPLSPLYEKFRTAVDK
ncbi:hypothetical protein RFI_36598, partial [Reticulomyxa filosa]